MNDIVHNIGSRGSVIYGFMLEEGIKGHPGGKQCILFESMCVYLARIAGQLRLEQSHGIGEEVVRSVEDKEVAPGNKD